MCTRTVHVLLYSHCTAASSDGASQCLQGNNFTYSCGAQQSYINDICLTSGAPSPSQLPPMGTTTPGSRTAIGGLPRTNQTLPANNGSLPDQMQYPGTHHPVP